MKYDARKMDFTQEFIKSIFDYDPDEGILRWKAHRSNKVRKGAVAGSAQRNGYIEVGINGKQYLASKIAYCYVKGVWPNGVRHINEIPSDCRFNNLVLVDKVKSDHAGVYQVKSNGRWVARINVQSIPMHIGVFKTRLEAIAAKAEALTMPRYQRR